MRIVVCEWARVEELADELARAEVDEASAAITHGGLRPGGDVEWVGLPPSPDGGTFDLWAPEEGASHEPRWIEYRHDGKSVGWNYTRNLIAFRVDA